MSTSEKGFDYVYLHRGPYPQSKNTGGEFMKNVVPCTSLEKEKPKEPSGGSEAFYLLVSSTGRMSDISSHRSVCGD
jgi:hypothetical protein